MFGANQAPQPRLNAFITVASDTALQSVKVAEREIQEGNWKGPLHGLPIGIKDFYDTAGIKTTAAFEHFTERVPKKDGPDHFVAFLDSSPIANVGWNTSAFRSYSE